LKDRRNEDSSPTRFCFGLANVVAPSKGIEAVTLLDTANLATDSIPDRRNCASDQIRNQYRIG
jgi:hypothetical protein